MDGGLLTKIRSYGYLSNRGKEVRMAQITTAMQVPAHPTKIKVPWMVRLVEKFGVTHTQCPHCKKDSLQLVLVQYHPIQPKKSGLQLNISGRKQNPEDATKNVVVKTLWAGYALAGKINPSNVENDNICIILANKSQ